MILYHGSSVLGIGKIQISHKSTEFSYNFSSEHIKIYWK